MEIVRTKKEDKIPIIEIGDWLCSAIRTQAGEEKAKAMQTAALDIFNASSGDGDLSLSDVQRIFELFLSHEGQVFALLHKAKADESVLWAHPDDKSVMKPFNEIYKEAEEFFIVLISLIKRVEDGVPPPEETPGVSNMIASFNSQIGKLDDKEFVDLRLRLMQFLYNTLRPVYTYRFATFMCILKYAAAQKAFEQLMPYIDFIDSWIEDWRLDPSRRKKLFLLLGTELKEVKKPKAAFDFLLRFANEFQGTKNVKELNEPAHVEAALSLALDAFKLPGVLYVDEILKLDIIQNLPKAGHGLAVELLRILETGTKADLKQFFDTNVEFCQRHELDFDASLKKLRIVWLSSCATSDGEPSVKLSTVSSTLDLSLEEAEALVAKAIAEDVLDATFDQVNGLVLVRSSMKRQFTASDWVALQSRLAQWISNTRHQVETLKEKRLRSAAAAGSSNTSSTTTATRGIESIN